MFISTVIDPPALTSASVEAEGQLVHLLRGVALNGIVLCDNNSILRSAVRENAAARQNVALRELLIRIYQDFVFEANIPPKTSIEQAIAKICDAHRPDLVVTDRTPFPVNLGTSSARTSSLASYHVSEGERLRVELAGGLKPMDEVGLPGFGDLIRRTTRFSKWIRVYDPYLGKGEGESRFKKGLSFLIDHWRQGCLHSANQCSVELITVDHGSAVAVPRLEAIVKELQIQHKIKFDLLLVRDPNSRFHARHFETREFVVQVDPGFDFFASDNTLRRILLKSARSDRGHLAELRRLTPTIKKSLLAPI